MMTRPAGDLLLLRIFLILAAGAVTGTCLAAESCEKFIEVFHSVPLVESQIPAIHDFRGPWPKKTFPLETGYGEGCEIGKTAEIVAMCPDGKTYPLIPQAPVIASDPEGFTVVMIGREDHERLEDKNDMLLFYAQCK